MELILNYVVDNIEWIFSGLGVTVIGFILKHFFDKRKEDKTCDMKITNNPNMQQTVNVYTDTSSAVISSGKKTRTENYSDKKGKTNILFIDDEKFDNVEVLKQAGWINTRRIKDIKRIDCDEVKVADVLFIDINGVGSSLFPKEQGLGVAAKIKERYKDKYVVVYSAQPQQLHPSLGKVDAVLSKDADPYQFINILENLDE